ncbi:MAG TPA: ribosome silencing factor [Actinomycetota bacterium]|jgi:ribosome-associated protein|nr:ribosome silencing factor [Actinomycetota bacterium]
MPAADEALKAASAASSKKAERISILDVSQQLVITDFFVICSGNTERHVRTIAEEVEKKLREDFGVKPYRREGEREARWVLLDYVDFVVHVFHSEEREYYDLERLWADAGIVPFDDSKVEDSDEPAAAEAT